MVFVLDNYDSFTYNLVQYLGELGSEVVVRRNDQVTLGEIEAIHPDRILVSPGPCTPREAGISIGMLLISVELLLILIIPMIYYVIATNRSSREAT